MAWVPRRGVCQGDDESSWCGPGGRGFESRRSPLEKPPQLRTSVGGAIEIQGTRATNDLPIWLATKGLRARGANGGRLQVLFCVPDWGPKVAEPQARLARRRR